MPESPDSGSVESADPPFFPMPDLRPFGAMWPLLPALVALSTFHGLSPYRCMGNECMMEIDFRLPWGEDYCS